MTDWSRAEKWIEEEQGRYTCHCGCDKPIPLTKDMYFEGVIPYIVGHEPKRKSRKPLVDIEWTDDQLKAFGLLHHKRELQSIGNRLVRICKDMEELGLRAFVDATNNIGIHHKNWGPWEGGEPHSDPKCIIMSVGGPFDGGDW